MMKVLLVEDNPKIRCLIKSMLDAGQDTVFFECPDGSHALAAYTQCQPDWVLMDIEMPELDGISAARQIVSAFPNARIAIVTDYDHPGLRKAARDAGASAYVIKDDLFVLRALIAPA